MKSSWFVKALELDIMDLLCSVLEMGTTKEDEEAAIHTLVILGLLTDAGELSLVYVCVYIS